MGIWVNCETMVTTLIVICLMTNLAGDPAGASTGADTYLDNSVASFIGEDSSDRSGYSLTGAKIKRRGRY